jgi:Family of unknown function (DUF6152)
MTGIFARGVRVAIALVTTAAAALVVPSAHAHHSASMFDRGHARVLEGTVREFQWANPHAWLQVEVADGAGGVVEWSIEMGGINTLARNGYRPTTFRPGDPVAVQVAPLEDGGPAGLYIGARLADGTVLGEMPESR